MSIFDTHAHLLAESLKENLEAILQRASDCRIVNIATSKEELLEAKCLLGARTLHAAAITPHDAHTEDADYFLAIEQAAQEGFLAAIGETGLEYLCFPETKAIQQSLFIRHMKLAKKYNLPLIIHCREAFCDLFSLLDAHFKGGKVLLHCFTGTKEELKMALDRNCMISISGIVTFPKSIALQEVVKQIPLEHLVVETDAPWLAPVPKRGKLNEPSFLHYTLAFIASLRNLSKEELCQICTSNSQKFFAAHQMT